MTATRWTWPAAGVALLVAPCAQAATLKPLVDARLRWEHVDQQGLPREADAVTVRVRSGVAATAGRWQALVESEATLAIVGRYNDGTNGRGRYPLVVDPQNIELNRAQLRYEAGTLAVTAGRQRIELADQRFVGAAPFRQNDQTFDAVRVQWGKPTTAFADVTYAWSDRTVNGIQGRGVRQQAVGGGDVFALAGAATPLGTLTGFAYLVDEDEAAVQGFRLSSRTLGARLVGARRLPRGIGLAYVGSWARQTDMGRNPNRYRADYWLVEATVSKGLVSLAGGQEVLGADDGRPLTSVQTPFGSLFKFQGWADKFTTTPPDGIRDRYATLGAAWKRTGPFDAVNLSASYHRFRSDRLDRPYGDEIDLLASARRRRTTFTARYARYDTRGFATDTDKFWLQTDWVF